MKSVVKTAVWIGALELVLSGCQGGSNSWLGFGKSKDVKDQNNTHEQQTSDESKAVMASEGKAPVTVDLIGEKGSPVGKAVLTQLPEGVQVKVEAANLSEGKHGIHFHENGKCAAPDFQSAGAHLNPDGKKHGFENPLGPHAGDLPNLEAGADGTAKAEFVTKLVTLEKGKPNSLLKPAGTALVIHEKADDNKTDPAGDSGARIACGVIQ